VRFFARITNFADLKEKRTRRRNFARYQAD